MLRSPLLIATTNPGKSREFREMFRHFEYDLRDLTEMPGAPVVHETGRTFRANACLKAIAYARHYQCTAIADDSGLEVDALNRKPGVHSARWAEMHQQGHGDAANNRLLLQQLATVPDHQRTARFVCVLAVSDAEGRILFTARDSVEGRLLRQERGSGGFGYDPLFFVESLGKTTAELTADQKHEISHRGRALRRLVAMMRSSG